MGNIITKKAKLHNNYQPNYLRFKLLNSDIIPDGIIHYISIMSTKTQENLALQYKLNDSEWIDYIPNYQYSYNTPYEYPEITVLPQLSDNNDILYIRRKPDAGIIGGVSSLTDLTYFKDNLLSFEMPVNLFTSTPVCIEGNIMSILDATMQSKEVGDYGLHHLFMNTGFAFTENLKLPATILGQYAYYGLFNGTNKGTYTQNVGEISITRYGVVTSTVPKLPATNLSKGCYQEMFSNCAIAQFPELPATVMAEDCYKYMFFNCITSRTLIDYQLPATTLAPNCYHGMFANSKGLFGTLTLPAPVLEEGCYRLMFYGFNKSVNIPVYHSNGFKINWEYTTTLAKDCCMDMFNSAGNIEYSIPEINDLTENCYYQMYANCSITNTGYNIELPATNLAAKCYYGMFYNCDMSLAFSNPIILPATEMKPYCYKYMFAYSGRSFYNIELPAMILAPSCYEGMFIGCSGNTWVPDDNNQIILPAENLVENCYKEMFRESRCCNVYIHAKNTAKSCCEYMFYKSYFVSINSTLGLYCDLFSSI